MLDSDACKLRIATDPARPRTKAAKACGIHPALIYPAYTYAYGPLALLQRACSYVCDSLVLPYLAQPYATAATITVIMVAYQRASTPTTATVHGKNSNSESGKKQSNSSINGLLPTVINLPHTLAFHTYDASTATYGAFTAATATITNTTATNTTDETPPSTHSPDYYYGYRYYSPELGRWINRDPIWESVLWIRDGLTFRQEDALSEFIDIKVSLMSRFSSHEGFAFIRAFMEHHPLRLDDYVRAREKSAQSLPEHFHSQGESGYINGRDGMATSRGEIGVKAINLYNFVGNTPTIYADVLGLLGLPFCYYEITFESLFVPPYEKCKVTRVRKVDTCGCPFGAYCPTSGYSVGDMIPGDSLTSPFANICFLPFDFKGCR